MWLKKVFLFFLIFSSSFLTAVKNENPVFTPGSVVYSFGGGKVQCLSEVDPQGRIVVLLKNLTDNVDIKFQEIKSAKKSNKNCFVIKFWMIVTEDTDVCAEWKNAQEVNFVCDPLPSQTISLNGKQIHSSEKYTVLLQ